jgi:hypothetical protein
MNIKQYGAFIYFTRGLFNDLLDMTGSGSHSSEYKDYSFLGYSAV